MAYIVNLDGCKNQHSAGRILIAGDEKIAERVPQSVNFFAACKDLGGSTFWCPTTKIQFVRVICGSIRKTPDDKMDIFFGCGAAARGTSVLPLVNSVQALIFHGGFHRENDAGFHAKKGFLGVVYTPLGETPYRDRLLYRGS